MSRVDKINSQIKRELTYIIQQELDDPHLGLVSIVSVDTSKDLSISKVFFSVFGGDVDKVISVFESMKKFIRGVLAERMRIKYIPDLKFISDDSIEYSVNIHKKIEEVKNALGKDNKSTQGEQ